MKTQIIQIESHDDTISVKDKMGWSQTGRLVLVWPARGQVLDRRLDLVLLLRHSHSLGVQISLVTRDPDVRIQAQTLGIQVFKSVSKAQKSHWRRSRQHRFGESANEISNHERLTRIEDILSNPLHREREVPQYSPNYRFAVFSLGVLAVLSMAAVLLPSAEIALIPETRQQSVALNVQASPDITDVNLTGTLPVRRISATVEGRGSMPTTGTTSVPTGFASGEVQFHNLTDNTITIPLGTVVSSSEGGQKFKTKKSAHIAGNPGASVIVPVEALNSGDSSNLPEGQINIVEGELGVYITVENLEQMTGGGSSPSPAPADSDFSRLRKRLISNLQTSALQEIYASLEDGDFLLVEIPSIAEVLEEEFYPPGVHPASELNLTLRLEFTAPYISIADQELLAESILDANLPEDYSPLPGTLNIKHLSSPTFAEGEMTSWRIQFSRSIQSQPATNQAVSLSLGRSPSEASQQMITSMPLSGPPKIVTSPSWWPVLPLIPMRIDVTTGQEN